MNIRDKDRHFSDIDIARLHAYMHNGFRRQIFIKDKHTRHIKIKCGPEEQKTVRNLSYLLQVGRNLSAKQNILYEK